MRVTKLVSLSLFVRDTFFFCIASPRSSSENSDQAQLFFWISVGGRILFFVWSWVHNFQMKRHRLTPRPAGLEKPETRAENDKKRAHLMGIRGLQLPAKLALIMSAKWDCAHRKTKRLVIKHHNWQLFQRIRIMNSQPSSPASRLAIVIPSHPCCSEVTESSRPSPTCGRLSPAIG